MTHTAENDAPEEPTITVVNPDGSEEQIVARTKSGKVLTEDDVARLADDEAAEGADEYRVIPPGKSSHNEDES